MSGELPWFTHLNTSDWLKEWVEIQASGDDITSKYVPYVNVFYG